MFLFWQNVQFFSVQLESFKNFDFESWRAKYLKWIQAKKFRITDFFRRQDKDGDGFLNQEEFVNGMLQSSKDCIHDLSSVCVCVCLVVVFQPVMSLL